MGAMPASRYAFGSVPWYSVLIVSAIVIGLSLCGHEQKRLKLPADLAIDLALCLIPSAIVGARLYYVAFSWDVFAADPLRILRIWEGGLAIYGGILGGAIALLLFCAVRHMPLLQLADVLVPALALGQGHRALGQLLQYGGLRAADYESAVAVFPGGGADSGRFRLRVAYGDVLL